jgi:hypothetical protein
MSEVVQLTTVLAGWEITLLGVFGPYDLLNISYADGMFILKLVFLVLKNFS